MARTILLPYDPQMPIGVRQQQTAAEWLVREMRERILCCTELFFRMQMAGYTGKSSNIISMWRSGATAISLRTLPILLDALGMSKDEQRLWVRHFTWVAYPELWAFLGETA